MKKVGYLLIIVGFIAGALTAVVDKEAVKWGYFAAFLGVGVAGIVMVRMVERQKSVAGGKPALNMQNPPFCSANPYAFSM